MQLHAIRSLALGVIGSIALTTGAFSPPAHSAPPAVNQALSNQCLGGGARHDFSKRTGFVNSVKAQRGATSLNTPGITAATRPESAARGYFANCGSFFGLRDQATELRLKHESPAEKGASVVKFQQTHGGVPIIGGEVNVQLDANKGVQMVNGDIQPDVSLNTTPTVSAAAARQTALTSVAAEYLLSGTANNGLAAAPAELWIYEPDLIGFQGPTALVWRLTVTRSDPPAIRQLVLVDARDGTVLLSLNQLDTARNRMTYDMNNGTTYPGTLRCDEANPSCTGGDADEVNAHLFAGDTYNFYLNYHNRDSINNAGMTLNSYVHYDTGYCNAFWDGSRMTYGDGCTIVVDDVVAHEMTHGVTQYESGLIYANQSGAINESFSDIWGEFVDLTNTSGTDTATVRWLMGEDTSIGAIRDMKNPPRFSSPDRMGSPYYYTGTGDNGGVHYNSGVGNKAAYLITDGDTFNGYTITGIGITKAAKIFYKAQADILTSGANYASLGAALFSGCNLLVGTDSITTADCDQVRLATYATEMVAPGPAAPSGLVATVVSPTQANLTWVDNSTDELGFRIERKATATGTWAQLDTTAANVARYTDTGLVAGTVYFYRVRSYNAAGNSLPSNEVATGCTAAITAGTVNGTLATSDCPSTLRSGSYADSFSFAATAGTTYTITLNSTAFDTYLYLLNGATVVASNDDSNGTLNSRIVYTATVSGPLTIHATSYRSGATGAYVLTLVAPDPTPPTPPSTLSRLVISPTQINLSWVDTSTSETGFRIERKTGATGAWAEIGTTAANVVTFANTGLTPSTTYFYRVRAYNAAGNSGYSNEVSATTPPPCSSSTTVITAGTAQSGTLATTDCGSSVRVGRYYDNFTLAVTAGTTYTITLNSTAFDAYLYLLNGSAIVASNDDSNGTLNSQIIYRATATTTLTIHATSFSGNAVGAYTTAVAVGTLPAAPTNLTVAASSSSQINLAWAEASNNETGFRIERKTGATGAWAEIGITAANATSYSNTGLSGATSYYYRVRAYNASGNSGYSNEATVTTPANCTSSTTVIPVGTTLSGSLATTDCRPAVRPTSYFDSFTFQATAGQVYTIRQNSTAFDSYLYLFNSAGSLVAANDDSNGTLNSQIVYTASASGTMTIQATSYAANAVGAYTVGITSPACSTSTAIAAGVAVSGTLAATDCQSAVRVGSYYDTFTFPAVAGTTYTITLNSTAFDAYLVLLNSAGTVLSVNDDYSGVNSRIVYTATASGPLTIYATSFRGNATGAYTVMRN